MTGFAVQIDLPVFAGAPFVRGRFVTAGAQCVIGRDRHVGLGVFLLQGTVTGFARHTFFSELS